MTATGIAGTARPGAVPVAKRVAGASLVVMEAWDDILNMLVSIELLNLVMLNGSTGQQEGDNKRADGNIR
jgi:hypothetical protein